MSSSIKKFTTKNGQVVSNIAKVFIATDIGQKIPTVSEFQEKIDVSRGTIQNSIKELTKSGAVTLEARGALGTFLKEKDLKILLDLAQITFLIGAMPLPYSPIYEGLATGILQSMENKLNIPVNMAYMRGAQKRIEMITNNRYDFAIVSKHAALEHLKTNDNIQIIQEFGERSFLNDHVLMFSDKEKHQLENNMKIGVDYDSIDQLSLTKDVTKSYDMTFVPVQYNQLIEKLHSKEIDVTIWNGDEIDARIHNIRIMPLPLDSINNTVAVIIINKERHELKKIIGSMINIDDVLTIQRKVIDGKLLPSY